MWGASLLACMCVYYMVCVYVYLCMYVCITWASASYDLGAFAVTNASRCVCMCVCVCVYLYLCMYVCITWAWGSYDLGAFAVTSRPHQCQLPLPCQLPTTALPSHNRPCSIHSSFLCQRPLPCQLPNPPSHNRACSIHSSGILPLVFMNHQCGSLPPDIPPHKRPCSIHSCGIWHLIEVTICQLQGTFISVTVSLLRYVRVQICSLYEF